MCHRALSQGVGATRAVGGMYHDRLRSMRDRHRHRYRFQIINRRAVRRLAIFLLILTCGLGASYFIMIRMPGKSYSGLLPTLTDAQRTLADEMQRDVTHLAETIGVRNVFQPEAYAKAAQYIESELTGAGYECARQSFNVSVAEVGVFNMECVNLIAERTGTMRPEEIIVIGAHYDTCFSSPGANDNGSGVAATLALARRFAHISTTRTIRFVMFANEEPPFFQTDQMGSMVYAKSCQTRGDDIRLMIALETIGCFSDEPDSQSYPFPFSIFYPSTGNFIAFVGNVGSRRQVRDVVRRFRREAKFPSEGGAIPGGIPGVGWSDHWAFWQHGYPALMVTDTAPYRYAHYHQVSDTPDKLDYDRMAILVDELARVIEEVANSTNR